MTLPQHIAGALGEIGKTELNIRKEGQVCAGAQFHSPTPLQLQSVQIAPGKVVDICGTCWDNLLVYLELKKFFKGEIPWEVRREFGNRLRSIGDVAE